MGSGSFGLGSCSCAGWDEAEHVAEVEGEDVAAWGGVRVEFERVPAGFAEGEGGGKVLEGSDIG